MVSSDLSSGQLVCLQSETQQYTNLNKNLRHQNDYQHCVYAKGMFCLFLIGTSLARQMLTDKYKRINIGEIRIPVSYCRGKLLVKKFNHSLLLEFLSSQRALGPCQLYQQHSVTQSFQMTFNYVKSYTFVQSFCRTADMITKFA